MSDIKYIAEAGELEAAIADSPQVVVKFTGMAFCRPCQQFAPHYEAAAEKSDGTVFIAVDVDEAPWAMGTYGVQSVPTVMLYRNGEYIKHLTERRAITLLNEIKES